MKNRIPLLCQVIGLLIITLPSIGCESNQLANCRQEKHELKMTIEAQKAEIDKLQGQQEKMMDIFMQTTGQLEQSQRQPVDSEEKMLEKRKKLTPAELEKGLAELEAMQKAKAERMKAKATDETRCK